METVRAVIEAFGKGDIDLPAVSKDAPGKSIREGCQGTGIRRFTQATVAEFLGWTRKANENGVRPNFACESAFEALDQIESGYLKEAQLRGLTRTQMREVVNNAKSIRKAHEREAEE